MLVLVLALILVLVLLPADLRALLRSGHHHEDGTQSDSEDPALQGAPPPPQQAAPMPEARSARVQPAAATQVLHKPLQDSPAGPPGPERLLAPQQGPQEPLSQQAFIIEFFDDNPRKKRSQSFTHNPVLAEAPPGPKAKAERRKGGERPASVHGHLPPAQQVMVPLKGHSGPQRSSSLKRDQTEPEAASPRPFGSVGKQSKLAREFAAEVHSASAEDTPHTRDGASTPTRDRASTQTWDGASTKTRDGASTPSRDRASAQSWDGASTPTRDRASTPTRDGASTPTRDRASTHTRDRASTQSWDGASPPPAKMMPAAEATPPTQDLRSASTFQPPGMSDCSSPACPGPTPRGAEPHGWPRVRAEEDDSLSDAGTYTIETEAQDREVEQARNMIDQVSGQLTPRESWLPW